MTTLFDTTLVAIDTTPKAYFAVEAINRSLGEIYPTDVKLLTDNDLLRYAVKIPKLNGLEAYSKFCIRDLYRYVDTKYCLLIQYDGYVLFGGAWMDEFLNYDYIGAPFNPSRTVGNGGFSLRSKRLMEWIAAQNWQDFHPEDSAICVRHAAEISSAGFKFAPYNLAKRFAIEGRSWNSTEWEGTFDRWTGEFGFHSLLTPLPAEHKVCNIAVHSGDSGDVVYAMGAYKQLGGGMLFLTPSNKFPYPMDSRWTRTGGEASWVDNLAPLIEEQPYMLKCRYTHGHPASTTHDLNRFRLPWKNRTAKDFDSILKLHCDAFNVPIPTEPWLTVPDPIVVEGRPIVVNRTPRYQNDSFPWDKLCAKYGDKMVFVGTPQEASVFQGFAPEKQVPHYPTKDALEMARVVAGAKLCIMNQSLPLAIAHGLYKRVITECWSANSNCEIHRAGATYVHEIKDMESVL